MASTRRYEQPMGPLRDKRTVSIAANDFEMKSGFVAQAVEAGTLTYRTIIGETDETETVTAGEAITVAGVPVLLRALRSSSAVNNVVIGIP